MNQLTTTNNFTLEETLMEKVFEASGYQFTIITPNGGEPCVMGREIADAFPMPLLPPLTIATLPFRPKSMKTPLIERVVLAEMR